ncbi:MAG: hypothetical protein BIP78_0983 [Candidatus Bipolaricaulis sibiricus]|uniref:Uncharacterized protein n=1 Tax=Bipolaricaulis sibiricus TaxID=2501609 RepID=A0A410FUI0_BIPS1|nr:MAG: hypothetical protein BIP78_0983 [Candidatus Bipolaricaulis sibiricus]
MLATSIASFGNLLPDCGAATTTEGRAVAGRAVCCHRYNGAFTYEEEENRDGR